MKKASLVAAAIATLCCASCGKPNNLYPVSGKVFFKGEPAVNAAVFLRDAKADPLDRRLLMGIVRDDGSFSVVCESEGSGAPPGDYDVLIEWKHDAQRRRAGPSARAAADRLKGAYSDPNNPRFRVTVKTARNVLAPFELTD